MDAGKDIEADARDNMVDTGKVELAVAVVAFAGCIVAVACGAAHRGCSSIGYWTPTMPRAAAGFAVCFDE